MRNILAQHTQRWFTRVAWGAIFLGIVVYALYSPLTASARIWLVRGGGYDGCMCADCWSAFGIGGAPTRWRYWHHLFSGGGSFSGAALVLVGATIVSGMAVGARLAAWRDRRSARASECPGCGYCLAGLIAPRCPECGVSIDHAMLKRSQQAD